MGTIAKSSITLSSISDAYSVSLTPSVCVIHADFDGSNPVLTNAYTLISVYCGEVKVPFTVKSITASHETIAFRGNKVDDNNYQLLIKGFSNDVLEGYLEIVVDVNGLITLQSRFMFTVERETTMLDWIQDWQNNKTMIGSTSIITPKLFVGKKITGSHNSLSEVEGLTGVYIGPSSEDSCGVYGYKNSVEIFHLDETGGKIGGWDISEGGLYSSNGKLRIQSDGSIYAVNDESDAIWKINADGSASFAMENVRFYANGDAEFTGTITTSEGHIGGWIISKSKIFKDTIGLDCEGRIIGVARAAMVIDTITGELPIMANIRQSGGVGMHYTSSSDWGLVGYGIGTLTNAGKKLFSLGSQNFIAGWNFDDTSLYIGAKNNNASQYTDASGSLTIGTEGLRGSSWYIDKDGTASFVKGLVSFGLTSGIIAGWTIIDNKFAQNHIALTCATGTAGLYMTSSDEGNFIERGPDAMEGFIDSKGGIYLKVKADSADFAAYDTNGSRLFKIKSNGSSYIAGWCFNNTTLYTGTQATSGYTTTGNITIGPTGLRGYKWRFENDGSGAVAGGNIAWDENGNVTFADKVSILWNQGIQVAQMMAYGQMLYRDPEFTKDKKNGTQIYAYNSFDFCIFSAAQLVIAIHDEGLLLRGTALIKRVDLIHSNGTEETVFTGNTQITPDQSTDLIGVISSISESDKIRISYTGEDAWLQAEAYDDDSQSLGWLNLCGSDEILGEQHINTSRELVEDDTAPNSTQKVVKFTNTRWISTTDFRLGGFLFANKSRVNGKFVVKIVANIPVGWKIDNYHNAYGNGGKTEWTSSQLGTGSYTEYVCVVTCGSTGSFETINHFALSRSSKGDIPIAGGEFESSIKYDSMDDQMGHSMPKVEWYVAYATVFDATSSDKLTTTIDAHGIYTGTLRADQIVAGTIDATKISADVILSNGKAWALNKDGSGYLANSNIKWDENGNTSFNGKITATSGKISSFNIDSGYIYNWDTNRYGPNDVWNGNTENKINMSQIGPNFIRMSQSVGYFNAGDIAYQKIGIGAGADPTISNEYDTYCGSALYIYRKMNSITNMYFPAAQIISDNVANRNIGLRIIGGLQVHGGVIESGHVMEYSKSGDATSLDLSFGTTFLLVNNASESHDFFFPQLYQVREQLGISDNSSFCVPIKVICGSNSNKCRISAASAASNSPGKEQGGSIVDNNGNWDYQNDKSYGANRIALAKGDSWSFALVYTSNSGYYIQILNTQN